MPTHRIYQRVPTGNLTGGFTYTSKGPNSTTKTIQLSGPSIVMKGYPWIPDVPVDENGDYKYVPYKEQTAICDDDYRPTCNDEGGNCWGIDNSDTYQKLACNTFTMNDIMNLTAQGENMIRLGVSWQGSHPIAPDPTTGKAQMDPIFKKRLENFLKQVQYYNDTYVTSGPNRSPMGVMIDFHQDFGGFQCGYGIPSWFVNLCNPNDNKNEAPRDSILLSALRTILNNPPVSWVAKGKLDGASITKKLNDDYHGVQMKCTVGNSINGPSGDGDGWFEQPTEEQLYPGLATYGRPQRLVSEGPITTEISQRTWTGRDPEKSYQDKSMYDDYYLTNKCCRNINDGNFKADGIFSKQVMGTMDGLTLPQGTSTPLAAGGGQMQHFINFWKDIDQVCRKYSCVFMYELINEPPCIFRNQLFNTYKSITEALQQQVIHDPGDFPKLLPAIGVADMSSGVILPGWLLDLINYLNDTPIKLVVDAIITLLPIPILSDVLEGLLNRLLTEFSISSDVQTFGSNPANQWVFCWHWYGQTGTDWAGVPNALRSFKDMFANIPIYMTEAYSCNYLSPLKHMGHNVSWWHYAAYCNTRTANIVKPDPKDRSKDAFQWLQWFSNNGTAENRVLTKDESYNQKDPLKKLFASSKTPQVYNKYTRNFGGCVTGWGSAHNALFNNPTIGDSTRGPGGSYNLIASGKPFNNGKCSRKLNFICGKEMCLTEPHSDISRVAPFDQSCYNSTDERCGGITYSNSSKSGLSDKLVSACNMSDLLGPDSCSLIQGYKQVPGANCYHGDQTKQGIGNTSSCTVNAKYYTGYKADGSKIDGFDNSDPSICAPTTDFEKFPWTDDVSRYLRCVPDSTEKEEEEELDMVFPVWTSNPALKSTIFK